MLSKSEILRGMQFSRFFESDPINLSSSPRFEITYQFAGTEQPGDLPFSGSYEGWRDFTAAEIANFKKALAHIETFLNVSFIEVTGQADPDMNVGLASLSYPTTGYGGSGVWYAGNTITQWDGGVIFEASLDLSRADMMNLLLHEVGHALGLQHTFDEESDLPSEYDNNLYSVMSYTENPINGQLSDAMMLFDVVSLQDIWGTAQYNSGHSRYTGPRTNMVDVIWDTGGTDTLDAAAQQNAVELDLREGFFSSMVRESDVAIAFGTVIEQAFGGSGADIITGNHSSNELRGGAGDDTVTGLGGNDRLEGQAGNDNLSGHSGDDDVFGHNGADLLYGNLGRDRLFGHSGNDTLWGGDGNDSLHGGRHHDRLFGNIGDDMLRGNAGDDWLRGDDGNDWLLGHSGHDSLFGDSGTDRLEGGYGNDSLHGGKGHDSLFGGSGHDMLRGNSGNDLLRGHDGADRLSGRSGNDRIFGDNGTDRLYGDNGNDSLHGGNNNDRLFGGNGDDRLRGNTGKDTLDGQTGNDLLTGGLGADQFVFGRSGGHDTIDDFQSDMDRLQIEGHGDTATLFSAAQDSDQGVLFDFGDHTLLLRGITLTDLSGDLFV